MSRCESASFRTVFPQNATGFVWFCVFIAPDGKFAAGTTNLSMALRKEPDNTLVLWFPVAAVETPLNAPYFILLQGYGAQKIGQINTGKYRVEIYSSNAKVGEGSFEVH